METKQPKTEKLDRIVIPKGALIHIGGMPFKLKGNTVVLGRKENYECAMEWVNSERSPGVFGMKEISI